ncbi:MAG: hypothetical protein VW891_14145 [Novosphingobium sp.]
MLELVEIKHEDAAATTYRTKCRQHTIEPLRHPVAVEKAGKRIEFGGAAVITLASVLGRDVAGHAAITIETAVGFAMWLAAQSPPSGPLFRFAKPHDHFVYATVR